MVYGYQQLPNQNINYNTPQGAPGQQFGANVPLNNGNNNPYGQNFTAVDTQQLKQDAVQLSNKAKEQVEDNFAVKMFRDFFGIDLKNPKKTITAFGLALATVVGIAALGNSKFSVHKLPELGIKVSDALKGNKIYQSIKGIFDKGKGHIGKFIDNHKLTSDIKKAVTTNRVKPKTDATRGYGQGFVSIFSLTPVDILKKALKIDPKGTNKVEVIEGLKKLVGDKESGKFYELLTTTVHDSKKYSNREICKEFTKALCDNFGYNFKDKKSLYNLLSDLEKGSVKNAKTGAVTDVKDLFTNVKMNGDKGFHIGNVMSSWWPVNFAEKAVQTVTGNKNFRFGRGNLGNSLLKYNVVAGDLADTGIGKFIQKSVLVPTESISNFVNDKSGVGGSLLFLPIVGLYSKVLDAPKEKKPATMADDFVGTIGSIAIATPLAFGTTYTLGSLKNTEGKGIIRSLLRGIGRFFGGGLDYVKDGKIVPQKVYNNKILNTLAKGGRKLIGGTGGAFRFILIMFVFAGMFSKPIRNVIHKIFGKPYDPAEEEALKAQQAQAEALKNLNMTEEQMMQKLQAHPEFVQALQNDPQTMAAIEQNPALLLQMIAALPDTPAGQPINGQNPMQPQGFNTTVSHSQMLDNYINNPNNKIQPKAPSPQINTPNETQPANQTPVEPVRTYIPSSSVNLPMEQAPTDAAQEQAITNPNVQAIMAKADRAMDDAVKFLG